MMQKFTATIEQFGEKGEKTGWTYICIPPEVAEALMPGSRKAFRVRGTLDGHVIERVSTTPMGEGRYILPLNAAMRKGTGKRMGSMLEVALEVDESGPVIPEALAEALREEPAAAATWEGLAGSHRNYFINWVASAKGEETRAFRIAATLTAMLQGRNYGETLRALKAERAAMKKQ